MKKIACFLWFCFIMWPVFARPCIRLAAIHRMAFTAGALKYALPAEQAPVDKPAKPKSTAAKKRRLNDSLRADSQRRFVDSVRRYSKGFPVAPFHDTLFVIYTWQGSFTAAERAEAFTARIQQLERNPDYKNDALQLRTGENFTSIAFGTVLLAAVSDRDALMQNTTRDQLAGQWRDSIAQAIKNHREDTRWQNQLRKVLLALLVIAVTGLLIFFLNKLFRRINERIRVYYENKPVGIRIKTYTLLTAERQLMVIGTLLKLVRWCIVALIVYLALPVLLNIFTLTRNLPPVLIGYITKPLKDIGLAAWNYVPNLITIAILVFIFNLAFKLLRFLKNEVEAGSLVIPGFYKDLAAPTYQIMRILTLAFLLVLIFPYLPGSQSPVFKGVSVFMGVLFTFGSASALGNIISGLVMTYTRAFKLGDRVTIGETTGDVLEKTLLVTRVRTVFNEIVSIPNLTVMSNRMINFSGDAAEKGLIVHTSVTIGYDAPWRQVHQLLIDAALATNLIEKEPAPFVIQAGLNDFYVEYTICAYTHDANKQAFIYSELHQNIQDKFNEAGVEIMSPHYKSLRDGNATTIPPGYLPKDYVPPAFETHPRK